MIQHFTIILFLLSFSVSAQIDVIPHDYILNDEDLINLLETDSNPDLKKIQTLYNTGDTEKSMQELTVYLKDKFSERYFFDWRNFSMRFSEYNEMYPDRFVFHKKRAYEHLDLYPAYTQWKLPFSNLKGEVVTSYPYRHLTRQHKSNDIALLYHYTKDSKYLHYIPRQAQSLNEAFSTNQYEFTEDGNGVYEVYRAGNRMYHWLFVHQCLLASDEYSWQEQLTMIKTFLHTGAQLHLDSQAYREGNHQTRGMSALAMLAILFQDFKGTDEWWNQSIARLEEHLIKEIYPDGFQFERSVHYHIGDIANFFYPYQIAHINNVSLKPLWDQKIMSLFDVMVTIAMPDKNAPALQDGGGRSGFVNIEETMALGTALFGDSVYNYFASSNVSASNYWFLKENQVERLKGVKKTVPTIGSIVFPQTGYYVMRQGWSPDDLYMIVNAGITPEKPDHLHGDMLGIIGYAYGNMVLPNFAVGYSDKDFFEFKNSLTKNVVQVDSIRHGRGWIPNAGRTGFGSWTKLPIPEVFGWFSNEFLDFFTGSHDGYNDIGVETYRSIFFIKDGFWIVNDQLVSETGLHTMQQVWQGHYYVEKESKHLRSTFENGAGLDIVQLGSSADDITKSSIRGKGRAIFEKQFETQSNLVTLLYPFKNFEERVVDANSKDLTIKGWQFYSNGNYPSQVKSDAQVIIKNDNKYLFIGASEIVIDQNNISFNDQKSDVWLEVNNNQLSVINCGINTLEIEYNDKIILLPSSKTKIISIR